jgi:hypothetical protein
VNRSRPSLRRLISVAIAVAAGLAGAAVITSPASASVVTPPLEITGTRLCDLSTGGWQVTWTLTNNLGSVATLTAVTPDPGASGAIFNQPIIVGSTIAANGTLVGHQLFPTTQTTGSLSVTASFGQVHDPVTVSKTIDLGPSCKQVYTATQDCHGITLTFKAPPQGDEFPPTGNVTIHPSTGSDVTFTLPLTQDKVISFPGSAGLTVTVTITLGEDQKPFVTTHTWTHDPCPSPTLPVTGNGYVGGAAKLGASMLLIGAGLIVISLYLWRRRRALADR